MKNIFSIIFLIMIILVSSFLVYDGLINNGNVVWSKAYHIFVFSQISDQEWAEKYNAHPIVLAYKEKYSNVTLTQNLGYTGKYLDYTVSNSTDFPRLHIWIANDHRVHFILKCENPRASLPITVSMQVDIFNCSNRDTIEGRGFMPNQQEDVFNPVNKEPIKINVTRGNPLVQIASSDPDGQLQSILYHCKQQELLVDDSKITEDGKILKLEGSFSEYSNGTHYINNNSCEWKERGFVTTTPFGHPRDTTGNYDHCFSNKTDPEYGVLIQNFTHILNPENCEWELGNEN